IIHIQKSFAIEGIRCLSVFDHRNLLFTLVMLNQPYSDEQWQTLLFQAVEAWNEAGTMYFALSGEYDQVERTAEASIEARELLQYHILQKSRTVLFPADLLHEQNDHSKSAID